MATNKRSDTDIVDTLDHDLAFCMDLSALLTNQEEQTEARVGVQFSFGTALVPIPAAPSPVSLIAVFDELESRLEKIKMNTDELWRRLRNATRKPIASIA